MLTEHLQKTKINLPLIKEWTRALRSSQYIQTYGFLKADRVFTKLNRTVPCFCATGVLLDISEPSGWVKDRREILEGVDTLFHIYFHKMSDGEDGISLNFLEDIGVPFWLISDVIYLNDRPKYKCFDLIADFIEKSCEV